MGRESPGVLKYQIRDSGSSFLFLSTRAALSRAKHTRGEKSEGEIRNEKMKSKIHFLNIQEVLSAPFLLRTHIYLSCTPRGTQCHLLSSRIRRVHLLWLIKGIIKGIKSNVGDWQIFCVIFRTLGNGVTSARWHLPSIDHFWSGGSDPEKIKQHNSNLSPE